MHIVAVVHKQPAIDGIVLCSFIDSIIIMMLIRIRIIISVH